MAAARLYEQVSASILNAPMSYFDTTPQGRVVSRFTFDTEQIDIVLTQKAVMFMISCGWMQCGNQPVRRPAKSIVREVTTT